MDLSVTNNARGRRKYGTVYGSTGHRKYVGQKTIWYSLWICRSQIIRGAEDSMVQFMDLSVTNNAWGRRQYGTVYGSIGHKKYVGTEDNMVQFMDLSVTKNTWGRRQYGTVYGSVGHKKYVGQKTIWYSLWIYRSQIIRGTEDSMVQFMDLIGHK